VVNTNKQEFSRADLMPNINNFVSDVETLSAQYTKYTVSRIIADKQDDLLRMEVPVNFPSVLPHANIELSVYSLADNSLVFSGVITNENDAIFTETLQYTGTNNVRNLLYIDFTKITATLDLPFGQYSVTFNFFVDEIGSYNERILKVSKISTSRTEVELSLTDASRLYELQQFAVPRINKEWIHLALGQIFNQPFATASNVPMSDVRIDSESVYRNFDSGSGEKLLQYNFDEDDGVRIGINTITQNVLNIAYPIAKAVIDNAILANSSSFTETQLNTIVIDAIDEAYDSALNDEARNPQNYRFDLI
jgi:hypothetical protein